MRVIDIEISNPFKSIPSTAFIAYLSFIPPNRQIFWTQINIVGASSFERILGALSFSGGKMLGVLYGASVVAASGVLLVG